MLPCNVRPLTLDCFPRIIMNMLGTFDIDCGVFEAGNTDLSVAPARTSGRLWITDNNSLLLSVL